MGCISGSTINSIVKNCSTNSKIISRNSFSKYGCFLSVEVGGIVGYSQNGAIENCQLAGDIDVYLNGDKPGGNDDSRIGGIVGNNRATFDHYTSIVRNCFNSGTISVD